jgi:hypothetical protein
MAIPSGAAKRSIKDETDDVDKTKLEMAEEHKRLNDKVQAMEKQIQAMEKQKQEESKKRKTPTAGEAAQPPIDELEKKMEQLSGTWIAQLNGMTAITEAILIQPLNNNWPQGFNWLREELCKIKNAETKRWYFKKVMSKDTAKDALILLRQIVCSIADSPLHRLVEDNVKDIEELCKLHKKDAQTIAQMCHRLWESLHDYSIWQ